MSLGQVRDVNNREVFKNHEFCAEFLRDYTDLALLKNITADDIEDVTEKYHAATVHKQNTGDSRNLSFRYPPILPIVYYEGVSKWTAPMQLKERIFLNEIFAPYIPDFTYRLVNVHNYSNDIIQIIINALWALFMKMQVPTEEATSCIKKVVGGGTMGNWFENMEHMDIQAERRATQAAKTELTDARTKLEYMKSELSDTQSELSSTQSALSDTQQKLAQSEEKNQQLETELAKLRAKIGNKQ